MRDFEKLQLLWNEQQQKWNRMQLRINFFLVILWMIQITLLCLLFRRK